MIEFINGFFLAIIIVFVVTSLAMLYLVIKDVMVDWVARGMRRKE